MPASAATESERDRVRVLQGGGALGSCQAGDWLDRPVAPGILTCDLTGDGRTPPAAS